MAEFDFSNIDLNNTSTKDKNDLFDFSNVDAYSIGEHRSTPLPNGSIDLGNNFDGSKKYSFDSIYEDAELINNAKEFYETRDDIEFDTSDKDWRKDVVDEYINDRTWKQANITSAFIELSQVSGMKKEQLGRLKYLTEYWHKMPNFWEDGGRSASSAIWQNLKAGVLDWTNVASGGFGAIITKTAGKKFVKELGKEALNRQVAKTVAKATIASSAFDAGVFAAGDLAIQKSEKVLELRDYYDFKRAGVTAIIGAGVSVLPNGLANYGAVKLTADMITIPKETGNLPNNVGTIVKDLNIDTGEVTEVVKHLADDAIDMTKRSGKVKAKLIVGENTKQTVTYKMSVVKQNMFDKDNFFKLFQYAYTGVAGSAKAIVAAVRIQPKVTKEVKGFVERGEYDKIELKYLDPSQLTYFKTKDTAAHTLRADDFLENGVSVLKLVIGKDGKIKSEYIKTGVTETNKKGNRGILPIIKDFDDVGEGEMFLHYVLAKRSFNIMKQNDEVIAQAKKGFLKDIDTKIQLTPFHKSADPKSKKPQWKQLLEANNLAKEKAQKLINYGEGVASQVGRNEKSPSFIKGLEEWKTFYDDMVDYSVGKGLHSADDAINMKAANPTGYIPMRSVNKTIIETYDMGTSKIIKTIEGSGTGRRKKKLIGDGRKINEVEVAPLLKSSIDYVYHMIKASDVNDQKLSFYKQLDLIPEKQRKAIATEYNTSTATPVELDTLNIIKRLEKLGIEINKNSVTKELDEKFSTMGFTNSFKDGDGRVLDIVYRNVIDEKTGKLVNKKFVYEIKSSLLQDALLTMPNELGPFMNKVWSKIRYVGRLPARAITYSPPFVAFNFIRDSLSATVNSSFGLFNPLQSFKGFGMTFAGNTNGKNVEKMINAVRRNDEFRKALISGLGLSTRKDVERFSGINNIDSYGKSQATGWYKKNLHYLSQGVFGRGARGYGEFVTRIEYASRYAEYMWAKDSGLSSTAAAILGREVSTDFAMKGSNKWLNRYSSVTMFFNAGLQGFYRGMRIFLEGDNVKRTQLRKAGKDVSRGAMIDTLSDANARALIAVGATVIVPELTLHHMNRELPEYQDVPDEVKMLNYLKAVFEKEKADNSHLHADGTRKVEYFIAIPKPYDFGVFGNIATGIYEGIMKKSPGVAMDYIKQSFSLVMPGFAAPTLLNPWFAIFMNRNWLGDQITPHGYSRLPGELQRKSNTRESAKLISTFINKITSKGKNLIAANGESVYEGMTISPIVLDYIMSAYLTGIASYPLDMVDAMVWDESKKGEKATARGDVENLAKSPWSIVTRRFQIDTPIKNAKSLQLFYDIRNKARTLKAGANYVLKDFESVINLEFKDKLTIKEIQEALSISPWLEMVSIELTTLRDRINKIKKIKNYKGMLDKSYTGMSEGDIKKADIDFLMQIQNDVANKVLKDIQKSNYETIQRDIFGYTEYEEDTTKKKETKSKKSPLSNIDLNSKFFK